MKLPKRTILVVGMGTSPAVLTETVWELAHLAEPILPDEVSVIATKSGRDMALSALRDEGADKGAHFWEKFRSLPHGKTPRNARRIDTIILPLFDAAES